MLGIIGLIFVIIAPFYIYRTAKQNGHNAIFWSLAAFGVGIGLQVVIPLFIGIVLAVIMTLKGVSQDEIQQTLSGGIALVIGLICLVLSVVGVFLIMKKVSSLTEDESFIPPPPPSSFNLNG